MITQDLSALAPLWIIGLGAAAVLLLTVAGGYRRPAPTDGGHLVVVGLVSLALAMGCLLRYTEPQRLLSGAIVMDGVSASFGFTAALGAFLSLLIATAYLREHRLAQGEFTALLLLGTLGMLVLVMAGDLLTLFVGIEIMSLAVYILAGYRRAQRRSQEAALKYFVYGAFASGFVIYGIALLYGEVGFRTGTPALDFVSLRTAFASGQTSALGFIGVAAVFGGLAFKIAAVPFHMWAPDVYEGAPTASTAFMAVGVKTAAFAGLCRFVAATLVPGARATETSIQMVEVLAILTMVVGNLLAIRQTQIKRMLAYSSIAHAGYLLVGVAAFLAQPRSVAMEAIAYYLLSYTAMTVGAFGVVLAFERHEDKRLDLSIDRLAGAAHRYPALGLAMAVFMFALAGIPPTTGFFGKLSLLCAALSADRISVVIVAVLASSVGAYYYLRVLVTMYMKTTASPERRVQSAWLTAGLTLCAAITLGLGILPTLYLDFARRALRGWLG
jgi:NADH-quinone oxidoreductase subunit N